MGIRSPFLQRRRIFIITLFLTFHTLLPSASGSSTPTATTTIPTTTTTPNPTTTTNPSPLKKIKSKRANSHPFNLNNIKSFINYRCNGDFSGETNADKRSASIWVYEGSLIDPFSGRRIADVEGLELVRHLTENDKVLDPSQRRGKKRLGDLKIKSLLFPSENDTRSESKKWNYASTVVSRKLFCYADPSDKSSLLKSIRVRPNGKTRGLAMEESVALYDTATTFISSEEGREMSVVTEWPDGRWVLADADVGVGGGGRNKEAGSFEYTVYARGRSETSKGSPIRFTPEEVTNANKKDGAEKGVNVSPPRSKLIQFGADKPTHDKYGARETYVYQLGEGGGRTASLSTLGPIIRNIIQTQILPRLPNYNLHSNDKIDESNTRTGPCTVRYTRYGECPPWYGPGRMCTLELTGRKVSSLEEATRLTSYVANEKLTSPGLFTSVHHSIPYSLTEGKENEEDDAAAQVVKWFREDDQNIHFLKEEDGSGGVFTYWNKRVGNMVARLREATTMD